MTYLVITQFYPTPTTYTGSFVQDQVAAIIATGLFDKVVVLRTMHPKHCHDYEWDGVKVVGLPYVEMPSNVLTNNKIQEWINGRYLRKTLQRIGVDIRDISYAHLHTVHIAHLANALKRMNPNIVTLLQHHDLDPYGINIGRYAGAAWNVNFNAKKAMECFRNVDCHLCISEAVQENLNIFPQVRKGEVYEHYLERLRKYKGAPAPKCNSHVLYNGVDTKLFHPQAKKTPHEGFVIGCIGNFQQLKNHITLIKAVEYLVNSGEDNLKLKLLGRGELKDSLEQYIAEHKLQDYITMEGPRNHEDLVDFLYGLDLFVLPTYFEGFGCVFTEAYACGVPFMTCRHQGVEEQLTEADKRRFMIEDPFDYKGLAKLIADYMRDPRPFVLQKPYDINILTGDYCKWLTETYKR